MRDITGTLIMLLLTLIAINFGAYVRYKIFTNSPWEGYRSTMILVNVGITLFFIIKFIILAE